MSAATIPTAAERKPDPVRVMGDAGVLAKLWPYLWEYRWRVFLALAFLVTAKLANITVPFVMKQIVDGLSGPKQLLAVPIALLAAYGALRLSSTLFNELRDRTTAPAPSPRRWRSDSPPSTARRSSHQPPPWSPSSR